MVTDVEKVLHVMYPHQYNAHASALATFLVSGSASISRTESRIYKYKHSDIYYHSAATDVEWWPNRQSIGQSDLKLPGSISTVTQRP